MKYTLLSFTLFVASLTLTGQVGIGTTQPDASAALDVESTTRGFLPPRMTDVQMIAINLPAEGLMVYCTDCTTKGLHFFDGTTWANISSTSYSTPSPFIDLPLEGIWEKFGNSNFLDAEYAQDANGTVYLQGLVKNGVTTDFNVITGQIAQLPIGMRPSKTIIFEVSASSSSYNGGARIDITPDGKVHLRYNTNFPNGTIMNYVSLAGISFEAVETFTVLPLQGDWLPFAGVSYLDPEYYKDANNTVFLQGLVKSGLVTATNGTTGPIAILPVGMRPTNAIIFELDAFGNSTFGSIRVDIRPDGKIFAVENANFASDIEMIWISLAGISFVAGETFTSLSYVSPWQAFGNANYLDAEYFQDTNSDVHLQGLIKSGVTTGSLPTSGEVAQLPVGMRPLSTIIFLESASNNSGVKSGARVDIHPDGKIYVIQNSAYPVGTTMSWVSLAGISFKGEH